MVMQLKKTYFDQFLKFVLGLFCLAFFTASPARAESLQIVNLEERLDLAATSEEKNQLILKIVQAYNAQGRFDIAQFYLDQAISEEEDNLVLAKLWEQSGNIANRSGNWDEGAKFYQKSLGYAPALSTYNNLAILYLKQEKRVRLQSKTAREGIQTEGYKARINQYRQLALSNLQKAESLAKPNKENASVIITLLELSKLQALSKEQLAEAKSRLALVPNTKVKVFLMLGLRKLYPSDAQTAWLDAAEIVAVSSKDQDALSFVWLEKGLNAEAEGNLTLARDFATKTVNLIGSDSDRHLYKAYWLLGRLSSDSNKLGFYEKAISALNLSLQGLERFDENFRLDFKEGVEPLYREALAILLTDQKPNQESLEKSLRIFDQLQLATLQSFFGDDCFNIVPKVQKEQENLLTEENSGLVTSILLEDSSHFILRMPDGKLHHSKSDLGEANLTRLISVWHGEISNGFSWNFFDKSQQLYSLVLKPFEDLITEKNLNSIVFVNDGILRNVPMAALHDGDQYVAEKWATINSFGLGFQTTDAKPNQEKVAAFGLVDSGEGWSPLTEVEVELRDVRSSVKNGKVLLNEDFTVSSFQKELEKNYSIVHIATHGYFGGLAENSFLVAHDQTLSAQVIENALRVSPPSLLVLSACETAISSDRSNLGLAGLAIRSGVKSVVGTFWQVQDEEQTELISRFYEYLGDSDSSIAIAVQKVQQDQIKIFGKHPSSWAALSFLESF